MSTEASANRAGAYVFPPALVRLMREQVAPSSEWLLDVTDDDLVLLFTTIFFAGLETHEGEHYPVSVAFLGHSHAEYVVSDGGGVDVPPLYRWKIMRFASPRPFVSAELVKLARACALGDWAFAEWLHGRAAKPRGMTGPSWSAAAFLFAERALER